MKHFLFYHNWKRWGEPINVDRATTNKTVEKSLGGRIWVITGTGYPKQFFLYHTFIVEEIGHEPKEAYKNWAGSRHVHSWDPPIRIDGFRWFNRFKNQFGNFGLGFQTITDNYFISKLAELMKSPSLTAKLLKPAVNQNVLGETAPGLLVTQPPAKAPGLKGSSSGKVKILLCNISWMNEYRGILHDSPRHGGKYIDENGFGHEAINFEPHNGFVYGFVQLPHGNINIDRLGNEATEHIEGVLVIWRARSSSGSVVVGWYKNATVFRKTQAPINGRSFFHNGTEINPEWIIKAKASDAFLIPSRERRFPVPVTHKGFGSQTFVAYLASDQSEVLDFKKHLFCYMDQAERGNFSIPKENALDDLTDVPDGNDLPDRARRVTQVIKRDNRVRAFAINRAKGRCEYCKVRGFATTKGSYYLETHHIISLGNCGKDTIGNVIALCPKHHRQAHYGDDAELLETKFITILKRLNRNATAAPARKVST